MAPSVSLPFSDRVEAGKALANYLKGMLEEYEIAPTEMVVLGLPRGGVVVAGEVAKELGSPLDVLPSKKLGAPYNPELAIGAVSVAGEPYLSPTAARLATEEWIEKEVQSQRKRISAQLRSFRGSEDFSNLRGKIALIVDDGTATGATAVAAVNAARRLQASSVWVAIPVAPPEALELLDTLADEVFCLASRADFQAVGMWYMDFGQTTDEEVREILDTFNSRGGRLRG